MTKFMSQINKFNTAFIPNHIKINMQTFLGKCIENLWRPLEFHSSKRGSIERLAEVAHILSKPLRHIDKILPNYANQLDGSEECGFVCGRAVNLS